MAYQAQVVMYLDVDLEPTARHTAHKPGNKTLSWSLYSGGPDQLPAAAVQGVVADTRLVIIGHGNPTSTTIGNRYLTPERLARVVDVWLGGTRIKRISLHSCYGGGNRGRAVGAQVGNFEVHPSNSFAFKFARYAGQLTVDVTARTDVVAGSVKTDDNDNTTSFQRKVGGRRKAEGDKFVFTTSEASTIANPDDPTMTFTWQP
jgi:hypothetical protein